MKLVRHLATSTMVLALLTMARCDFNPAAPFAGFDEQGSRLRGEFRSNRDGSLTLTSSPSTAYDGITVYVEQAPSVTDEVKSNGTFALVGLPQGTIAVVFEKEGTVIGRLVFQDVVPNQELRIVVALTAAGSVELLEQERDNVGLGECARGAGFWCQNRTGKNPNMSREDFETYADGVVNRFGENAVAGVSDLVKDTEDVERAVCDTGNQLLRQLVSVLLNIEADLLDTGDGLIGEDYPTVGDAVEAAFQALAPGTPRSKANSIKDVLDRINNNVNTDSACEPTEDDQDPGDDGDPVDIPAECAQYVDGHKVTVCHKNKNTLSISISALPAHLGHGDSCGPCPN